MMAIPSKLVVLQLLLAAQQLLPSVVVTNAFSFPSSPPPPPFAIQRRAVTAAAITVLNAALSSSSSSKRSREEELANLAQRLDVSPSKVRELLVSQRKKLMGATTSTSAIDESKVRRIDWLLDITNDNTVVLDDVVEISDVTTTKVTTPKKKKTNNTDTKQTNYNNNNDASLLSNIEFAQRSDLHPATKRAIIEILGLSTMTDIQAKTYTAALSGQDILGRARTGTGKTIAFLLPAIERLLRLPDYYNNISSQVGIVVISPTRELATQIGNEAEKLLTFHTDLSNTQVVFGGTKTSRDISRLNHQLPTVLVATPGRFKDLLQTATVNGQKFAVIMKQTPIIVLDETDQLLDLGFRREIQQILNYMGSSSSSTSRQRRRQTLLFSATVPPALKEIMRQTMHDDYVEVDCIKDGGGGDKNGKGGGGGGGGEASSTETHIHIEQSHVIIPSMSQYVPSIIRVVRETAANNDGGTGGGGGGGNNNKVVVFFPTARMVSFFADLFNEVVRLPVMELHSKKSQGYRNRVSGQFRECEAGILFTSDVSARGVDYPGVTHVVQLGMPSSREQYIHRLGRTGRAGASGKGWLVLAPFESLFLEELTEISIPKNPELTDLLKKSSTTLDETDDIMKSLMERIQNGDQVLNKSGEGAYQAFLGYYLGQMKRVRMNRKERLVEIANEFAASMGFRNTPAMGGNMVKKMGLDGVTGIFVSKSATGGGKVNSNIPPKRDGRSRPKKERWPR
jgi:ATP-dependent RNA helicase MSS116